MKINEYIFRAFELFERKHHTTELGNFIVSTT